MDIFVKRFNKLMNTSILMLLLDILVGIFLVVKPELITKVCAVLMGSLFLIHGIFDFIRYIYDGLNSKFFAMMIVTSLSSVILGVFMIFSHQSVLEILGIVFGIWMLLNGLVRFYYSFRFMQIKEEIYPLTMFISGLMVLMGVLVMFNPFSSFILITKLCGYFVIASSLLDVMYCLLLKRRSKSVISVFK